MCARNNIRLRKYIIKLNILFEGKPLSQGVDNGAKSYVAPGSGASYGVSRKPGHPLEYKDLTLACGAPQRRTEYFSCYLWESI